MPQLAQKGRPLSPHLTIYRPQITSISSIFTRITGNALIVAVLLVVWWFVALATGPEAFALADGVITSWFGWLVLVPSVWALWYHTLAGMRHLLWDTGRGLELRTAERLGWACFIGATLLTVLTFLVFLIF